VCLSVHLCAYIHVCVRVCMCVCVYARVCVVCVGVVCMCNNSAFKLAAGHGTAQYGTVQYAYFL